MNHFFKLWKKFLMFEWIMLFSINYKNFLLLKFYKKIVFKRLKFPMSYKFTISRKEAVSQTQNLSFTICCNKNAESMKIKSICPHHAKYPKTYIYSFSSSFIKLYEIIFFLEQNHYWIFQKVLPPISFEFFFPKKKQKFNLMWIQPFSI